ncbi:DUF2334 domain-containing protein [Congregicoccus parvus]|uniref:DUF2334 domain-containing protein n=1 Tax=Congregicoccus parvus TaxID=3081749 RepID=UPI003FA5B992
MSRPSSGISRRADRDRALVVSFHDLHPGSLETCTRFVARIAELGVDRATLLAVPRWHGGRPIDEHAPTVRWMREASTAGHEICLHGFFHRADRVDGGPIARLIGSHYTAGEGEFYRLPYDTAVDRIRRGLGMLVDSAGLPVVGFTPPAWLSSEAAFDAARDCGLLYTTSLARVHFLQRDCSIAAPTLVYSCRNAWRRAVSRTWVRAWGRARKDATVLRVSVHPGDFADPKVERSIYARIAEALASGRRPATYRELVPAPSASAPESTHAVRS